jgi:transcriptional regulator with XRE-family HTH domain
MTARKGSTVERRQLGLRLSTLREKAGRSGAEVAAMGYVSTTKLWRIETGQVPVKVGDVLALARFYGCDNTVTDHLVALAEASNRPGWWQHKDMDMPANFKFFLGLEMAAETINCYSCDCIPGLLQTAEYATANARATLTGGCDERRAAGVAEFRLERQRRVFGRTPPPRLRVILNEAALVRRIGDQAVMAQQCQQLRKYAAQEHLELRVLPFGAGAHCAMDGSFTLFEFDDPHLDPSVVYHELTGNGLYLEAHHQIAAHQMAFADAREKSVPLSEFQPS